MWGLMIRSNTICRFCRFYREVRPVSRLLRLQTIAALTNRPFPILSLTISLSHAGPTLASGDMRIRPADALVQTEHLLRGFFHQLLTARAKVLWKSGAGARIKLGARTSGACSTGR